MHEIWRHRTSGERFLVAYNLGTVNAVIGPLLPGDDPRAILERFPRREHNVRALLSLRAQPEDYVREYRRGKDGRAFKLTEKAGE